MKKYRSRPFKRAPLFWLIGSNYRGGGGKKAEINEGFFRADQKVVYSVGSSF